MVSLSLCLDLNLLKVFNPKQINPSICAAVHVHWRVLVAKQTRVVEYTPSEACTIIVCVYFHKKANRVLIILSFCVLTETSAKPRGADSGGVGSRTKTVFVSSLAVQVLACASLRWCMGAGGQLHA